jgi:putative phosphoesterase
MKVAIISDIHGNTLALEKVLKDIQAENVEHTICLGDSFINGPNPVETLRTLREHNIESVRGNTEDFITDAYRSQCKSEKFQNLNEGIRESVEWCSGLFTIEDIEYLESLPLTIHTELDHEYQLLSYHGTPNSNTGLLRETSDDSLFLEIVEANRQNIYAGGHTHVAYMKKFMGSTFLNPGSVGLPIARRNNNKTWQMYMGTEYIIIETTKQGNIHFQIRRIAIERDGMLQMVLGSDMPGKEKRMEMIQNATY